MAVCRDYSVKPLAAALTIALGMVGTGAHAGTPSGSAFAAQMQAFKNAVAQIKQDYAQHPAQFKLFPNAQPHAAVRFPKRHKHKIAAPTATAAVTSCVDDASSETTAGTLRYAVVNAVNGDVIDLSACNASTITLTQGALPVAVDDLTITAGAGNRVTIDGNGTDRVITGMGTGTGTYNVLALSYLTIRNGKSPVATIGTSTYPVAAGGCIFSQYDGVGLYYSTVSGCNATNTTGPAEGGGLAAASLYMYRSSITGNSVSTGSGAPPTGSGAPPIAIGGGAIAKYQPSIIYSHIDGNTATSSMGIAVVGGGLVAAGPYLYGSTISNNSVHMAAGSAGTKYLATGGGLVSLGSADLKFSTISGNGAACTTTSTTPNAFCVGGGVVGGNGPGGNGTLSISYSTISGNHADFLAGGVHSKYALNLAQSTISGNSAQSGGGLTQKYAKGQVATIYNSTIAANSATYVGAGIFDYPGGSPSTAAPIILVSSIVAKNSAGSAAPYDIYLPSANTLTIAGSNDLVMAGSSNITLPAGTLSADPMLAPLANNGGPTQTMGLYAGSPALDVGSNPNAYANDQRGAGFPRVVGAAVDIGAFEGTVAPPAPPVPAPALSAWALAALAGLLGFFGWRRRRAE